LLCAAQFGCNARIQPPGGKEGVKSDKTRKLAEELAVNVVNGAAKAQAKAIPELAHRGWNGQMSQVVVVSPQGFNPVEPKTSAPPALPTSTMPEVPTAPKAAAAPTASSPSQTKSSPRPGSPAIIKVRVVSSIPYASEAEAEEDALTKARDEVEQELAKLDPPVKYRPSLNEIKNEFARKDSRTIRPPSAGERELFANSGFGSNLVYAEYDVEVTADQIRELRTRDRIAIALRGFGGLTFIALAGFLFLRADEWTKGYLTRWLACAAVVLVGGTAAALYFV